MKRIILACTGIYLLQAVMLRFDRDVVRLMMGKGLVLVGIGTAIGLAMGFAVEQLMNSMLFNAGGVDIVAYVVVVPSLFLVTMLAAYVPARRASRIAPTQVLRYE